MLCEICDNAKLIMQTTSNVIIRTHFDVSLAISYSWCMFNFDLNGLF